MACVQIITGVVIAACSFNLPHLFEVYVVNCWSLPFSGPNYDVCPTALRQNEVGAISRLISVAFNMCVPSVFAG